MKVPLKMTYYKVVQIGLRGITLLMMMIALLFNSEYDDLASVDHFIMSGVYGSYIIVTLGLLIEAGLQYKSDKFIEAFFLAIGISLNLICSFLAFVEYAAKVSHYTQAISKGLLSVVAGIVYLVDMAVLFCT